jgi:Xaa-Pro aminopeptidase
MYEAVLHAQQVAFSILKAGIAGAEVHAAVEDHFKQSGFHTDLKKGYGFIHSTGHGVGLDVHELPFLSKKGHTLEPGNVITVEPGLYYPDIGGVRLEDVVVITRSGNMSITHFEKKLVI